MVSALLTSPFKSVISKSVAIDYSPYLDLFFQSEKRKKNQHIHQTGHSHCWHDRKLPASFLMLHLSTYRIAPSRLFF